MRVLEARVVKVALALKPAAREWGLPARWGSLFSSIMVLLQTAETHKPLTTAGHAVSVTFVCGVYRVAIPIPITIYTAVKTGGSLMVRQ